jgi:urease accessory protein
MILARLLQLASPTLPVGAYSYSQGLEAAVEAGIVTHAASAQRWIGDVLEFSVARMEAPVLWRMMHGEDLNDFFLATRETAELRAETLQMGHSLAVLLKDLSVGAVESRSYPAVYAFAVSRWQLEPRAALVAYLWSWAENQVMAAIKSVPLGQTDGQKILLVLGSRLDELAERAVAMEEQELCNFTPGLAFLSSRHEKQYSRLFRS